MVLDREAAAFFIAQYTRVLGAVHRLAGNKPSSNTVTMLAAARKSLEEDPALLVRAVRALAESGEPVPSDMLGAVRSQRLRHWVYLRDTTTYSIFISPEQREAFGVRGLTNPIRDLLGGSAVVFRTCVVEFRGRYVCDGIVESPVWLGANYKRECAGLLKELKEEGRMHVRCEP
jgi:hypothetical protein